MKHLGLVMIIVLALAGGLCLLVATADDRELAPVALTGPATRLSFVANRLHAVYAAVCAFVRAL